MLDRLREKHFDILALHHAEAIFKHDLSQEIVELETVLANLEIPVRLLVEGGGGESEMTQALRNNLSSKYDWKKHRFEITKTIDGKLKESISHEIDHVKFAPTGTIALEIEWNNKDPFFDRDLENFKRLHADGVISVGVIITRGASLQDSLQMMIEEFATRNGIDRTEKLSDYYDPTPRQKELIDRSVKARGSFEKGWSTVFVSDKFGQATTHWTKLYDRVKRGVGNPCPLLLIGIPKDVMRYCQ